jgi:hypothetical protein
MSVIVERGIKLIPTGGDNIIKVGVTSTSKRLSGYVDATSVPYVTSFTFINQDIDRIIGLETLNDLSELDIRGNRYFSYNPVDFLLDQKPIKLLNFSDTPCYGFMSFLTSYPGIEYFYANNTLLSGDIKLPSSIKLAEIQGYSNKSTLIKEIAPLTNNSNLVYLNVSNNKLKGSIEIGKLPNAIHLDFSKNKFSRAILNTLTVQTSNIRVFNIADNELAATTLDGANKNIVGLEDVHKILKYFEKLKRQYQKGKSTQNNYTYILNLSGALMPSLPSRPYDFGYLNYLNNELIGSLTASPYPWRVLMGGFDVKESAASINRARTENFADPDVRTYIRNWEVLNNEEIPTRDFAFVDAKVKRLKTITAPVTASMIETTNPALTSSGRCLLSSVQISPGQYQHRWYVGTFWDLVGLNFEPDPDHTEYIQEFKTSYLQSKGTSLIYYLELLWFIKTMKWLGYFDSMIFWPLKWRQYVNKSDLAEGRMLMVDSFGGGQINPGYENSGIKRHTLRLWFAKEQSSPSETDPLQTTTLQDTVLSGLDGVPFSLGTAKYGNSRFIPLRNSMDPDMWFDLGTNIWSGMTINTSEVGYDTNRRLYMGIPDGFTMLMNADVSPYGVGATGTTRWIQQQGTTNKVENNKNPWVLQNTEWPRYFGGLRGHIMGGKDASYFGAPQVHIDQRGAGMLGLVENDPYTNTQQTFERALCSELLLNENTDLNGYGWANWRELNVFAHPNTASNVLAFKNNDNLVWKFWKSNVQFPIQTSTTPPLTTLTYRYKCWHVPIESYDAATGNVRFSVGGVPDWYNVSLPAWYFTNRSVVDSKAITSGGGVQNNWRSPTLHGRFGHIRGSIDTDATNSPTHLKVSDDSGLTFGYKDATVEKVFRYSSTNSRWMDLEYKKFGDTLTRIPCADQVFGNDDLRGFIKLRIKDSNTAFSTGSFQMSTSLGFVPGTTGINLILSGTGLTDGIYTNVPYRYTFSTLNSSIGMPLSAFNKSTNSNIISSVMTPGIPHTPNLGNLQWYYYGNMELRNVLLPASIQVLNRPLFWDTTDTYALWWLTASNCFVITTTADANTAWVAVSNLNCLSSTSIFGAYRGNTSTWPATAHVGLNEPVSSVIGEAFFRHNSSITTVPILCSETVITPVGVNWGSPDSRMNIGNVTFETKVWDAANTNLFNLNLNSYAYLRYSLTPSVNGKGTVYVANSRVIAVSTTAPGKGVTSNQYFTFNPTDIGGAGGDSGVLFKVNGTYTTSSKASLKQSVTDRNPIGNYYFHTLHVINNTMAIQEYLDNGFNWEVNTNTEGNWKMENAVANKIGSSTITPDNETYYRFANDYSDMNFLTNHFIFNHNSTTTLTNITSIYVCGRWWNGLNTGSNPIRDNRTDDRYALDLIKKDNAETVLGTLTIENTATGEGMVFGVRNVTPEKRYRWTRSRRAYMYLDKVDEITQSNWRGTPINSSFFFHWGIDTNRCNYFGLHKTPTDTDYNEPSLSYYGYPHRGNKVLFERYDASTRTFTFASNLSSQFAYINNPGTYNFKVYANPRGTNDIRNLTVVGGVPGRNPGTGALSATTAVWDTDIPQGGGIMTQAIGEAGWWDNFSGVTGRDPLIGSSYVPLKLASTGGTFTGLQGSRRALFDPSYEGYLQNILLFKTDFTDLCANRWLKNNTLHTALTCFFYETSGNDLTPDIR